ncbi:SGNH/GDSL hydrolase family protein [Paenibacillus physcomitrellae]|uniref:Acyl-CoA thioesterase n=1 Tax=Paenibacillus physcomitrellae TaxID=1619311 RepID=A0ABQ1GFQ4_9BACL|nr:SGNH/GDSL hydrolase family protein [Paenibacillus physcomitrellae]GGA42964.1 acyl-CoA thioesterase [Paenibacillus physcomitrellae]
MKELQEAQDVHAEMIRRRGLPATARKAAEGKPVTVAFLGGSITEGAGASQRDVTSWRALTEQYLREKLDGAGRPFISVNAGVGGTDSTLGAHRLQEQVFQAAEGPVDLLFVEFSVNDGEDREESLRGMEGIVRACRRLSPATDLCFVYTAAEKNLTGIRLFNIAVHEEVAEYYDIPSVDFAAGVYRLLQAGTAEWRELAPDGVHPNDLGHALYARFMQEFLEAELPLPQKNDPAQNESVHTPAHTPAHMLTHIPAHTPSGPLMPGNYEHAHMLAVSELSWSEAFHLKQLHPDDPLMNWRYSTEHVYTEVPGAAFTFTGQGRGAGVLLLCGPDTGMLEYSINGGSFVQVNPFDDWCLQAYRPVPVLFTPLDSPGELQVTVRNTALKDTRSQGHGLRILRALVH